VSNLPYSSLDTETVRPNRFDHGTHWISSSINRGFYFIENRLVTGAIKFGLVPDILATIYVITQWEEISFTFLVASAFTLLWVNIAPYLIWYYDEKVMPRFFIKISEIVSDTGELEDISVRYNRYYESYDYISGALWAGGFIFALYFGTSFLQSQGMSGDGEIFLWTTYLYGLYVGAVLGEAGFSGTITTLLLVREVSELQFDIQPLHPDGLGGMSTVGYYAIRTTVLWSTASLLIPLSFQLISESSLNYVMITVVTVYIGTILFSFVYPTWKINRVGEERREQILDGIRTEYRRLEQKVSTEETTQMSNLSTQLEMERLHRQYEDYNNVRLYPMEIRILTRLVGSLILPLIFMLVELYLPQLL
jgi:hypothetical protein